MWLYPIELVSSNPVALTNAGDYRVVLGNAAGVVTSSGGDDARAHDCEIREQTRASRDCAPHTLSASPEKTAACAGPPSFGVPLRVTLPWSIFTFVNENTFNPGVPVMVVTACEMFRAEPQDAPAVHVNPIAALYAACASKTAWFSNAFAAKFCCFPPENVVPEMLSLLPPV